MSKKTFRELVDESQYKNELAEWTYFLATETGGECYMPLLNFASYWLDFEKYMEEKTKEGKLNK